MRKHSSTANLDRPKSTNFGNDLLQTHKLRLFSRIKLFEVGTCFFGEHDKLYRTCLKTHNQHNFSQDQTNLQKQIKLKVDLENNFYFCKKLPGADLN